MTCDNYFWVRGIIHCHSTWSYDGQNSLEELCLEFQKQGFRFVALTEHSHGITKASYREFVSLCERLSSAIFLVVPGLEILCPDGTEIAGVGLDIVVPPGSPAQVIEGIKRAGGFAVWVHPKKRLKLPNKPFQSHAIEVLNGKEDGTLAPPISLFREVKKWRKKYSFFMIVGLDLHGLGAPLNVWTECYVSKLSKENIMEALFKGNFINLISGTSIPSSGAMKFKDNVYFVVVRIIYLLWNLFLKILPKPMLSFVIRRTRSFVLKIKK